MNGLGVCDHGKVGRHLEQINMDKKVCKLVENHVNAKKYLVSTDTTYYNKLSEASKKTLEYQGGKMTPEEITIFQNDPDFISMIAVRFHDDNGKEINVTNLPSIEDFIPLLKVLTLNVEKIYFINYNGLEYIKLSSSIYPHYFGIFYDLFYD